MPRLVDGHGTLWTPGFNAPYMMCTNVQGAHIGYKRIQSPEGTSCTWGQVYPYELCCSWARTGLIQLSHPETTKHDDET